MYRVVLYIKNKFLVFFKIIKVKCCILGKLYLNRQYKFILKPYSLLLRYIKRMLTLKYIITIIKPMIFLGNLYSI